MSDEMKPILEGWFTTGETPHLLGLQCARCGTYYFPKTVTSCRNPDCDSTQFESVELSRTGTLWSFTDARYKPPEPYVGADPFVSYGVAAVELAKEKMIVLGQVAAGVGLEQLRAGLPMELVVEAVPDDEEPAGKLLWKWKPMTGDQA
jgi:uncharacterized OB-fold protein